MTDQLEGAVAAHYGKGGLLGRILEALAAAGLDLEHLSPEDLAAVDEFHIGGRAATHKALAPMRLAPDMHVLDAGCGIGGTVRYLAQTYGCRVTGIDLTPEFIDVARELTERVGLGDRCAYEVGSVTAMPFADGTFDAALTFHVAMNVADRDGFCRELARVLRPGAELCVFDVMKGPAQGMIYPVPWADTEATSSLKSRDETAALLEDAGFAITAEDNLRSFAIDFFREGFAKVAAAGGPPPLGLHLLTGANTREKFANLAKALEAHQVEPVVLIAKRS